VPTITSVIPTRVVEGGRIALGGSGLPTEVVPAVVVGEEPARTLFASSSKIVIDLPPDIEGGRTPVRIASVPGETVYLSVGAVWATGLHQVDNPVFDREGNLFVTYSGSRGQDAPVSIFRVTPEGTREPFVSGIVNATSMAFGPDGHLYVSSRFEGSVHRVKEDGTHEQVASDLGVACGLTFDADGCMYVGDRSGTIFKVRGGVSPGDEPRRGTLRHRSHARHLRSHPAHHSSRRSEPRADLIWQAAGPGVCARWRAARHRRAGRRERPVPVRLS
jgi:hypothetical protein